MGVISKNVNNDRFSPLHFLPLMPLPEDWATGSPDGGGGEKREGEGAVMLHIIQCIPLSTLTHAHYPHIQKVILYTITSNPSVHMHSNIALPLWLPSSVSLPSTPSPYPLPTLSPTFKPSPYSHSDFCLEGKKGNLPPMNKSGNENRD